MNTKLSVALLSGLSLFLSAGAYAVSEEKPADYINWSYVNGNASASDSNVPEIPVADNAADHPADITCTEGCPARPVIEDTPLVLTYEDEATPLAERVETFVSEDRYAAQNPTYRPVARSATRSADQFQEQPSRLAQQPNDMRVQADLYDTARSGQVAEQAPTTDLTLAQTEQNPIPSDVQTTYPHPTVQVQYPITRQYPISVQYPVTVQRNVTVEQPVIMQQPVIVRRPVVMQQAVTVQRQPTVVQQQPVVMQQQPTFVQQHPVFLQAPAGGVYPAELGPFGQMIGTSSYVGVSGYPTRGQESTLPGMNSVWTVPMTTGMQPVSYAPVVPAAMSGVSGSVPTVPGQPMATTPVPVQQQVPAQPIPTAPLHQQMPAQTVGYTSYPMY